MQPIPMSRLLGREKILIMIAEGKNDSEISRLMGSCRGLIRKVRRNMTTVSSNFVQVKKLGRPTKDNVELRNMIRSLTEINRSMGSRTVSEILRQRNIDIGEETVRKLRHKMSFSFLPKIETFELSDSQKAKRFAFALNHFNDSWNSTLFTDEALLVLGCDRRRVWRRRKESDPSIHIKKQKFQKKIMVYGGIAKRWKSPLIVIEGSITAEVYADECIDGSGLVPEMNRLYGIRGWRLMQDGATPHMANSTIEYLQQYCNILNEWPANSPDCNPIENLWAIIKRRVAEISPQTVEDLITTVFEVWEAIPQGMIDSLIDSMSSRMIQVVNRLGEKTDY